MTFSRQLVIAAYALLYNAGFLITNSGVKYESLKFTETCLLKVFTYLPLDNLFRCLKYFISAVGWT